MTDLSQSFNKLVGSMYENIGGCLVERLSENKYRWGKLVGTRSEIEKAITDAGKAIENSLSKKAGNP